ncbi:unnamed protein product [Brassica rapa]|uniref:Uncharacterized protein n=1 Tax=Brassica campestris TaxID=3711 RepID=A0A3P6CDK0_BRACM|nr:unnamed protein product [Brassica rapa]VDD12440.1 unnamed protein product [Brassica rapa]
MFHLQQLNISTRRLGKSHFYHLYIQVIQWIKYCRTHGKKDIRSHIHDTKL